MQYYKNYIKNNSDKPQGDTVICLNRVITVCTEKAGALYSCNIKLICPAEAVYAQADINSVVSQIATILDKYCRKLNELTVKLEKTDFGKTVKIIFADEDGNTLYGIDFERYTGIPGIVIRDPELDGALKAVTDTVFEKLLRVFGKGV